jgi:hypothetical protein
MFASATMICAIEAGSDPEMVVPRNDGLTYKQPTDHIPHESHSAEISWLTHQMTLKKAASDLGLHYLGCYIMVH